MIQGFRRRPQETELNITTFMNLMVILVPFLLITAVFSEITTLQLNLPQGGLAGGDQEKPKLQLELIVRGKALILDNAADKPIARLEAKDGEMDLRGLSEELYRLKQAYPGHTDITLRLEPDTKYAPLIALMDTARSKMVSRGLGADEVALFPDISIGDAPGSSQQGVAR